MKKIILCLSFLSIIMFNIQANAQEIAVINLEEIIKNSSAMTKFSKNLDGQKNEIEKKLKVEEQALTTEKNGLESELTHLSNTLAQEKAIAFQKKVGEFQNKVKENESGLQKKYMAAIIEVTDNVKTIISDMKKEKDGRYNFSVVLPKSSVLYNDSTIDISAEVLSRLNKKLTTIKNTQK